MTEGEFNRHVRDLAARTGWLTYHVPDSRKCSGNPGFPDLVLVRDDPRLIFAELKVGRNSVSAVQYRWLNILAACAVTSDDCLEVYIWRPGDWDEIVKVLKR